MKSKFFIFWLAGVLSTIIALPYIFALQADFITKTNIPPLQIGLISIVQAAVLLAIAVFCGLKLIKSLNFSPLVFFGSGVPLKENLKRIAKLALPLGIAVAVIIKLLDLLFNIPLIVTAAEKIPVWKVLLVAPYGGIVEELLMRLFIVSLVAWLLSKIFKSKDAVKNNFIMWMAIVVAAILFGLGHLPATATITPLTPIVVFRAILLNGIGGLVFGWLYWKKGLEYGIVAHFTTDIVLLAVLPALLK